MPRSSKPRHKRKNKCTGNPRMATQPWRSQSVFTPLERILDQLEQEGTVDVSAAHKMAGMPIYKETDGKWYSTVHAMQGVIEFFEIHASRKGLFLPLQPLILLAKKLEVDMPIFPKDTQDVRAALVILRRTANRMTADEAHELVNDIRISVEMDKIRGEAA